MIAHTTGMNHLKIAFTCSVDVIVNRIKLLMTNSLAERSGQGTKAWGCGLSFVGIAGSIHAGGMNVRLL